MSKIIFLNGCGSSGKTSIATAIQHLSDEVWIGFGVDSFIDMLPPTKQDQYFSFKTSNNAKGPVTSVDITKKGAQFFSIMPKFARLFADNNQNLIIDEVLFDEESLKAYAKSLSNHIVYYIGVFCDLSIMQEREILRGDRCIGLANDQIDKVHLLTSYDFSVDNSSISPFEAARQILDFINSNQNPQAFSNMKKENDK